MAEEHNPDAARLLAQLPEKPEEAIVPPGAEFAWEAFWRLDGDRPHITTGFGVPMGGTIIEPRPGRIPFTAIDGYARRYGITGQGFDLLVALIKECDQEFLAVHAEKAKERAARRN